MSQTLAQTWQIVNQSPLTVLETKTREPLDNLNTILDSKLDYPFRVDLSGSVLNINGSEIQTIKSDGSGGFENSFKVATPPIQGLYKKILPSSITLSGGSISGDFGTNQSSTAPSMTASNYVWMGVELRSDSKFYLVWGTQGVDVSSASLPIFTSGDSICLVLLKDSGSGGQWGFENPLPENVILFKSSSSLEKREDSVLKVNIVDIVSTSLPTGSSATVDSVTLSEDALVLFTQPSIEGIYRAKNVSTSVTWEKLSNPLNGDNVQVIDGTTYFRTVWKKVGGIWRPLEVADASLEPSGFPNRVDSTFSLSVSGGVATFTIQPTGDHFDYFIKGVAYRKNSSVSLTLSGTEGAHFVYFDGENLTEASAYDDSFILSKAYVSYIYWDATNKKAIILADERHGMSMDGATHKYLHLSVGTVLQSGLSLSGFTTSGDGTSNADAQVALSNGRLFDEDIDFNITNSASPSLFFEQVLSPIAKIPMYYRSGASGDWRKDIATNFPVKLGASRVTWNQYSGGSWSTPDVPNDNYFTTTWIFATNSVTEPVIAVMGQAQYSTLSEAQEKETFPTLNLSNFPVVEFKLCYRLIYQTSSAYTNTPKSKLASELDLRLESSVGFPSVGVNDHSLLSGLADPDHPPTAVTTFGVTKDGGLSDSDSDLKNALQTLNSLFGQLRLKEHPTNKKRIKITGASRILNNNTIIGQVLGSLLMNFEGAEIDFTSGNVYKSDGITILGQNFTVPTTPSGNYRWYSVSLIPNLAATDNTMTVSVLVLPSTDSNAVLASAPKAAFSSGQKIGQVVVKKNSTSIDDIAQANIIQLGIGTGSGGGTGDANSFTESLKHRLISSYYNFVTPVFFELDGSTLISSSTATFNSIDSYRFDNAGEYLISSQMFCTEFLSSTDDSRRVEVHAEWLDSSTRDDSATYQLSLDGSTYESVSMTRQGLSNKFTGSTLLSIPLNTLLDQTYSGANLELNSSTAQSLACKFTVSSKQALSSITLYINRTSSIPSGSYIVKLCSNNSNVPGDVLASKIALISTLSSGVNTVTLDGFRSILTTGDYFIVVETDASYKSSFSSGVTSISMVTDPSPHRVGAYNIKYNGSAWSTSVNDFKFTLKGHLYDLRIKVTSSAGSKKLKAFGLFYDEQATLTNNPGLSIQKFIFSGDLDKTEFLLTNFVPSPDYLRVYDIYTGQVYRYPSFNISGHKVTFDAGTFLAAGQTVQLIFDQSEGNSFDNSDINANLLASNHLGSTDSTIDKSSNGRGIILRQETTGLLKEIWIDAFGNLQITTPKG